MKYWSQQLGMTGAGVPECLPSLSEVEQDKLRAEMAAVGLIPAT